MLKPKSFKIFQKVFIRIILRFLLVFSAIALSLTIIEFSLRSISRIKYGYTYYLWPPYISRSLTIHSQVLPGIAGEKQFNINSIGIRGDELSKNNDYQILVMGGSTTEDGYLDDMQTWSYLLQEKLNGNADLNVWVGNAARRGSTLRDNLLHLEYFVSQLPKQNTIFLLVGINDFMYSISPEFKPLDVSTIKNPNINQLDHAFFIHPYTKRGVKGTAIWALAKKIKITYFGRKVLHFDEEEAVNFWRDRREKSDGILYSLPDMAEGLKDYEKNLNLFIDISKHYSDRMILLTQPSIWKKEMPQQEEALLWFGCISQDGWKCYSSGSLQQGMDLFNAKTLEICKKRQIECIDLANLLPKNTSVFADDVHFNESGARQVADKIADYLLLKSPFSN